MKDSLVYVTYNKKEMEYLTYQKGFKYVVRGRSITTEMKFYVYERSEEFNEALDCYKDSLNK